MMMAISACERSRALYSDLHLICKCREQQSLRHSSRVTTVSLPTYVKVHSKGYDLSGLGVEIVILAMPWRS